MIVIEGSLSQEHYETNDIDVSMWGVSGGMMPLTWPRYCVAYNFLGDGDAEDTYADPLKPANVTKQLRFAPATSATTLPEESDIVLCQQSGVDARWRFVGATVRLV